MARPALGPTLDALPRRPLSRLGGARSCLAVLLATLGGLTLMAAAGAQPASPSEDGSHEGPSLFEIPHPDLGGLEPAVREQLAAARRALDELLAGGEVAASDLADAYARVGQLYHAYGFLRAAEACYRNHLTLAPGSPRWTYFLAHVLEESGRFYEAAAAYARVLELFPRALPARIRHGRVLQALGRFEAAEEALRQALEQAPREPAALAALGEIALAQGRYGDAVTALRAALEAVPAADRLHYPLAMAYRGLGDLEAARRHLALQGKVGVAVDDPLIRELEGLTAGGRVHVLRGQKAFNAGRFQEAAAEFSAAVEADPDNAGAHINLGSALARLGEVERAILELRRGLELDPGSSSAHYNLGVLLARRGEDVAAVRHLLEVVRRNEADVDARLELAAALSRLARADEALEHYREAVSRDPASEAAWLARASLLVDLERYGEALAWLEEAHAVLPRAGRLALALARMLAACPDPSLRDGERALDLARRVHDAQPTPRHAATVAQALAELGRCAEAASWASRAVEAAESAGDTASVATFRRDFERYRSGPPCQSR